MRLAALTWLLLLCSTLTAGEPRESALRFHQGDHVASAVAVDLESIPPGAVGWALTARHVLKRGPVPITLHSYDWSSDGEPEQFHEWPAVVSHVSDRHDLALLIVRPGKSAGRWVPAKLAKRTYEYTLADRLRSYGCAGGRDPDEMFCRAVSHGSTLTVDRDNILGRSGGPLFNSAGHIVGIASTRTVGAWTVTPARVVGRDSQPITLPASSDFVPVDGIWSLWGGAHD